MHANELILIAVIIACAVAAWTDWRGSVIPNWITLPVLFAAPVVHGLMDGPWGALRSLLGALLCALVPCLLFWRGGMGGGDVKLLAAVGAATGYYIGLEIELLAFLLGSVYALGKLCWQGKLWRTLSNALYLFANHLLPAKYKRTITPELMSTLRFGGAIFVAAVLSLVSRSTYLWL